MKERWGYCHNCGWKKPSTKYRTINGKRVRLCDSCADDLKAVARTAAAGPDHRADARAGDDVE